MFTHARKKRKISISNATKKDISIIKQSLVTKLRNSLSLIVK